MRPPSEKYPNGFLEIVPTTRDSFCSPYTINLSGKLLEESAIKLLDRGLTFIPTNKFIPAQPLSNHYAELSRRLKIADYFLDSESDIERNQFDRLFIPPSEWTPKTSSISHETMKTINEIGKGINLVTAKAIDRNGQKMLPIKGVKNNLSRAEHDALKSLKQDQDIIIKPADKGGAVVVMNKNLYKQEGLRQLNNTFYYDKLDYPIFPGNVSKINKILHRIYNKGFISAKQLTYLKASDFDKQRYFYLLPKVHKDRIKWPNPQMPEGRPIVADCGSESYRISKYIDYFLQPLAIKHDSYLKDTYDFISKIRNQPIQEDWLLVTADVTALYTNMRIDLTIENVRQAFNSNPCPNRPDAEILELLELTLRNNDFEFAGEIFLQKVGTAMGKIYAPSLANMYLQPFDEKAKTGFRIKPQLYFRFLDDIHLVWPGNRTDLSEYEEFLNSLIPGIKITFNVRESFVEFLDTTVYKCMRPDGQYELKTKVYFKATDTHQLLHIESAHPRHTCRGVLKSQFIRFKRISSSLEDYNQACTTLWTALKNRGYSKTTYRTLKRDIWLNYDKPPNRGDKNDLDIIPVINFFDPIGASVTKMTKHVIRKNNKLSKFRSVAAYKIHKNLRRHLVKNSRV